MGLKTYLGHQQTLDWLGALAESATGLADRVDIVVFPVSPALPGAVALGRLAGFEVGAQDVSVHPAGAFTGETPAGLLAELGVRYVEIGHAERRFLFGESPETVVHKVEVSVAAGLVPLICVGEGRLGDRSPIDVEEAVSATIDQLEEVLPALHDLGPFVVAYEPVWAIGADEPAPVSHVRAVAEGLRKRLLAFPSARVIYGGTAGPGLFAELADATDGLFLGRRAHNPAALAEVLAEVAGTGVS